jgi:formylglycine-generating enzyme
MEFVVVGEAGNKQDPIYRFGHVLYVYEIGKFEITNQEYAEFLNAVAKYDDPHSLYSPSMTTGLFGGIDRLSKEGISLYYPKEGWRNRPVVYISWYDLARLANWYHYQKPCIGRSQLGTTEGTNTVGAYDTRHFPHDHTEAVDYRKLPFGRNKKALYWIPNEDEWYKAAHYDPTLDCQRKYWDYPVRTNDVPNNFEPPGNEFSVNFFRETYSIGKPNFLTEVGAYSAASSYFGTYDQGGNVWEWAENWRLKDRGSEKVRAVRGGSATYSDVGLHARNTDPGNPAHEKFIWGGRLARAYVASSGKVIYSDISHTIFGWRKTRTISSLFSTTASLKN